MLMVLTSEDLTRSGMNAARNEMPHKIEHFSMSIECWYRASSIVYVNGGQMMWLKRRKVDMCEPLDIPITARLVAGHLLKELTK